MASDVIAILYPGDMGQGVGKALVDHGHDVVTCLAGRSDASRTRAAQAGMRDTGTLEALVAEADLILSILPPEAALATAAEVAAAMTAAKKSPPFADCNAISPETTQEIGRVMKSAGAPYIDGGIIGHAPGKSDQPTRFYVSGPDAGLMSGLDGKGIAIRDCGGEVGRASAVKMCYASVSKGTFTLHTAALVAAEALGVGDHVRGEWEYSAPQVYQRMQALVPRLPADAGRWIGEMEEIAKTFESVGVTPNFHRGARDIFELLDKTPFASETRETIDKNRTMEQSVQEYARHLPKQEAAE